MLDFCITGPRRRRLAVRTAILVAVVCLLLLGPGAAPVLGVGDKVKKASTQDLATINRLVDCYEEGDRLAKRKKYDEALVAYEKAIEIHPYHIQTLYKCACVCGRKKDYEKAIDYLERAVKAGYVDYDKIKKEKALKSVRRKPAYKKLFKNEKQFFKTQKRLMIERLKEDYGDKYSFTVDDANMFIFGTPKSKKMLESLKKTVLRYAKVQCKSFFTKRPGYYVAVVVLEPKDYRECITNPQIAGQYNHKTKTLICKRFDPEYGSFLRHELTHALHYADAAKRHDGAQHAKWVREGLGAMYECSKLEGKEYVPKPNFRISDFRTVTNWGIKIPLSTLVIMNDYHWRNPQNKRGTLNLCYGMSRYLMMYLHEKGLLKTWYKAYTASFKKDPTGRKALEKVFNKTIDEIDTEWRAWLSKQPNSNAQAGG